jgi:hypothetical protein
MSDHVPNPRQGDRVRDTLTALRTDSERVPLASTADVRRRGQARTRNQAVAGLAAACVLVAVGIGAALGVAGNDESQTQIPASPSPSVSSEPLALAADPFLRPSDVPKIGVYKGFERSPAGAVEGPALLECLSDPQSLGATDLRSQRFFQELDARFVEYALRFDDASGADSAVDRLRQEFASCHKGDPADVATTDRGPAPVPGVDGSLRASRLSKPTADAGVAYFEIALVRSQNVVVLLEWNSMGNPTDDDTNGWAWNAERLQTAFDRAVG